MLAHDSLSKKTQALTISPSGIDTQQSIASLCKQLSDCMRGFVHPRTIGHVAELPGDMVEYVVALDAVEKFPSAQTADERLERNALRGTVREAFMRMTNLIGQIRHAVKGIIVEQKKSETATLLNKVQSVVRAMRGHAKESGE